MSAQGWRGKDDGVAEIGDPVGRLGVVPLVWEGLLFARLRQENEWKLGVEGYASFNIYNEAGKGCDWHFYIPSQINGINYEGPCVVLCCVFLFGISIIMEKHFLNVIIQMWLTIDI